MKLQYTKLKDFKGTHTNTYYRKRDKQPRGKIPENLIRREKKNIKMRIKGTGSKNEMKDTPDRRKRRYLMYIKDVCLKVKGSRTLDTKNKSLSEKFLVR